jgi:hypothetical protein
MRESSPTGGAVGPVSDRDLSLLSSVVGALDVSQGEKQLDRSLDDINKRYLDIQRRLMGTAPALRPLGNRNAPVASPNKGVDTSNPLLR